MLGIPSREDRQDWYESFKPLLKDEESRQLFSMPAQYMFKDIPETNNVDDFVKWTVDHLDRHNIETALVGFNPDGTSEAAAKIFLEDLLLKRQQTRMAAWQKSDALRH